MTPRDILLALAVVVVWGVNFVAVKWGVAEIPPLLLSGLRYVVALVPIIFFVKRPQISAWLLIAYGVFVGVGQFGFLFSAIKLGMPVNTKYGYNAIASLQTALINTGYADKTLFVAWEHLQLVKLVQNIMNAYGGGVTVPAWSSTDYDSLYVVRVTYVGGTANAQFTHEFEGLNGQPTACPY